MLGSHLVCCKGGLTRRARAKLAAMISRDDAVALDAGDELADWRERFVTPDELVYLDGNSLGMAPRPPWTGSPAWPPASGPTD